jgi:glycosyltransferase involved in cell wall biosynthesis
VNSPIAAADQLRVAFYTHPHFLDPALSFTRAMAKRTAFSLFLEISPGAWRSAVFDLNRIPLPAGIVPADRVLDRYFPPGVREYWRDTKAFNLVSHNTKRSLHPISWWVSRKAIACIRAMGPDLLHLDDSDVSLRLALAIRALRPIPLVLSVHDPAPHTGEQDWRKGLARALLFRHARHFILHNEAQRPIFCHTNRISPERVSVVRFGSFDVHREWIGRAERQQRRTILFFGRLSPYKGLELLHEAVQRVAERLPDITLVVAGPSRPPYIPPPPPSLANGGHIEVVAEHVANESAAKLFQRAAVVVCPYLDGTQSGVALTAYAFERPVVATAVGGLPEYVIDGTTGLIVPPRDPEALAAAIQRLLSDDELHHRLSDGIRHAKSATLSWEGAANGALEAYRIALSRPP